MRMTVILPPDGRSIQIPCGGCGALLKISLRRPAAKSGLSPAGDPLENKEASLEVGDQLLVIESLPIVVAPRRA